MKIFLTNRNSLNTQLIEECKRRGIYTDNPQQADVFVLWQDVRGDGERLAKIAKETLNIPVFVVQHGRGATRDYGPPNNFKLLADRILVWADSEKRRLLRYGIPEDRVKVVGSPFVRELRPKMPHNEKRVVFAPMIVEKEEPENIMVYAKLKQWESRRLYNRLKRDYDFLKTGWATKYTIVDPKYAEMVNSGQKKPEEVPHEVKILPKIDNKIIYRDGIICVPFTSLHDQALYHCESYKVEQNEDHAVAELIKLLQQTDVLVCMDEGTLALLATAMNIPVIHADVFKWTTYGGIKYDEVEMVRTPATYRITDLDQLPNMLDYCLSDKEQKDVLKQEARIRVVEDDLGPQHGDPIKNILDAIEEYVTVGNPR